VQMVLAIASRHALSIHLLCLFLKRVITLWETVWDSTPNS
jgi:hypothetical protein